MLDLSTIASLFEHYVYYITLKVPMYLVVKAQILYCSPYWSSILDCQSGISMTISNLLSTLNKASTRRDYYNLGLQKPVETNKVYSMGKEAAGENVI